MSLASDALTPPPAHGRQQEELTEDHKQDPLQSDSSNAGRKDGNQLQRARKAAAAATAVFIAQQGLLQAEFNELKIAANLRASLHSSLDSCVPDAVRRVAYAGMVDAFLAATLAVSPTAAPAAPEPSADTTGGLDAANASAETTATTDASLASQPAS